jgi:hypothetical protein
MYIDKILEFRYPMFRYCRFDNAEMLFNNKYKTLYCNKCNNKIKLDYSSPYEWDKKGLYNFIINNDKEISLLMIKELCLYFNINSRYDEYLYQCVCFDDSDLITLFIRDNVMEYYKKYNLVIYQ